MCVCIHACMYVCVHMCTNTLVQLETSTYPAVDYASVAAGPAGWMQQGLYVSTSSDSEEFSVWNLISKPSTPTLSDSTL